MQTIKILLFFLLAFLAASCSRYPVTGYNNFEVQAVENSVSADGVLFLKAWGLGKKRNDAIENAKRNAIRMVIFNGVPGSAVQRPLVPTPGAEAQHREYFDRFFAKDGKYLQYVTETSAGEHTRVEKNYKVEVRVKVFYRQLQKELENARIAQKFGL